MSRILVIAGVSVLAACASNSPVSPTGAAAANATAAAAAAKPSAPAPAAAVASKKKEVDVGNYKRVVKKGEEYFCRREGVTGSRTQVVEVCLTQAQLTALRDNSQELLRDVQGNAGSQPGLGPDGSAPAQSAVSY